MASELMSPIDSEPVRARGIIVDYIARCAHTFSELAIELLPSLPKGERRHTPFTPKLKHV